MIASKNISFGQRIFATQSLFCLKNFKNCVTILLHRKKLEIPKWNIIGNLNPNVGPLLGLLYITNKIPRTYQHNFFFKATNLGMSWHLAGELLVLECNDSSKIPRTYLHNFFEGYQP